MYKIISSVVIKNPNDPDRIYIPRDSDNTYYQQFLQDVAEQGIEIVEGPTIIEPSYVDLRQQAYPSLQEQQDMQYWDAINGTTLWQDTITAIKEEYPKTITGGSTIGPVPDWVQEDSDNWKYNKKLYNYVNGLVKLFKYTLEEDRPEFEDEGYQEYQTALDHVNEFFQEYLNS